MGVSRQCAHRWINRFDQSRRCRLEDRSSRPHSCPNQTHQMSKNASSPLAVNVAADPTTRPRHRCPGTHDHPDPAPQRRARLHDCDPLTGELIRASKTTAIRYERDRPGELVHVDVKKLGRIPHGGGWRAHGRQMGSSAAKKKAKIGFDYVHSMVDDHTRIAYSEIHDDEQGDTCAAFIKRAGGSSRARHLDRTSDDRQPLELHQDQRRRRRDPHSERHTNASGLTAHGRTAKSNASTAPSRSSGPTDRSSSPTTNAQPLCQTSSTATTTTDDTTPSEATHPSADCHQPDGRVQLVRREPPTPDEPL